MDSTNRPPAVQAICNLADRIDADGRHERIADPIAWRAIRDDLAELADEIAIQMANLANQRDNAIAQATRSYLAEQAAAARLAANAEQAAAAVDEANHRAEDAAQAAAALARRLALVAHQRDQEQAAAAHLAGRLAAALADDREQAKSLAAARLAAALAPLAGDTESQTPAAILARFEANHASALAFFELTAKIYEGTYTDPEGMPARIELWHGSICEQIVTATIDPEDLRSFFEQYRHIETLAYRRGQTEAKKAIAAALGL